MPKCLELRARGLPLGGENVAVIGVEGDTGAGERAERGAPIVQPLRVHAVARAIDVAAGDALVRLHQVERGPRNLAADRAREAPVAPHPAEVERIAADHAAGGPGPRPRQHGHRETASGERAERALDESLGTPLRVVALPYDGDPHRG